MITWASVDLPDPFGPMTAWTSPLDTSRSTPRRISLPSTPARSPLIVSVAMKSHLHEQVVALADDLVDGHGPGGGKRLRLPGLEREGAPVLGALDLPFVLPDVALGQGVVGVRAPVAQGVVIVVDADHGDAVAVDVEAL